MFGQTLYVQWKWNRDFLAFYTFVAFTAPLIILWVALPHLGFSSARELVQVGGVVGVAIAVISVCAGMTVAWQGYGVDERVGHIYALSLPLTRTRALAMRAASALVLLVVPALGVWVGSVLAATQVTLPPSLHSYAGSLAGRALLGEVKRVGADLLVMGAYGHSRLREMIFGGATREVLAESTAPVLMAH